VARLGKVVPKIHRLGAARKPITANFQGAPSKRRSFKATNDKMIAHLIHYHRFGAGGTNLG
jgi:hypothetical protein